MRILGGIVAIIVVAVLLVALLLSGVIPGLDLGGTKGSGASVTSDEAAAAATGQSYANGVAGGPWSLVEAQGVDTTVGDDLPVSDFGSASCPLTGSTVTAVKIPAYNGTYSTGMAEAWLLFFASTTGASANLVLDVENSVASEIGEASGPGCFALGPPIPGGVVNSPTAAATVGATPNGSAYFLGHAHSNATYYLFSASVGPAPTPLWSVDFAGCAGSAFQQFEAQVYAANGSLLSAVLAPANVSSQCGGAPAPIGSVLALGTAQGAAGPSGAGGLPGDTGGCTAGNYMYQLPVESSSIDLDEFELAVIRDQGSSFVTAGPSGFTVLNVTGHVIAAYPIPSASALAMDSTWPHYASGVSGATALSTTDSIVLDMGQTTPTTGQSIALAALGTGAASGTILVPLP
jgi:hypothetical protein